MRAEDGFVQLMMAPSLITARWTAGLRLHSAFVALSSTGF
eukprot:CAMPEP_0180642032 /NCGR_PEP_ID=MMETSP1037_2-20121125/46910_1 /TAXON_ID=632150 /ORGANISM="Azadinium spinosum, Strain 3D9" /LENGTH=39 /DNA_ID= /DNA_START= /DNA_END= /DNA_ORIENTATION=